MKLKNLRYIQMISVIMTLFVIVSFVPAVAVNDAPPQDSQAGAESLGQSGESQEATEQETESFSISFEAEEDRGGSGLGTASGETNESRAPVVISDGVYMLENVYHTGYYMSVRGASLDAGARIVPRQYSSGTPISTFDRQSLFKISKVTGTSRYVIRSMLNNAIGLGIVNGKVVTKELPFDDADVDINDTFTILSTASGTQISPYGNTNSLVAELGTSSDDPSVGAYVVLGNATSAGNSSKWTLTKYTGVDKYGFDNFRTAGMGDGLVKGYDYCIWTRCWSTVIGANTPCITVDSTYSSIVTLTWDEDELCATFTGEKCDDFQINMEIRIGDAQTATDTTTRGYTVIPDIVGCSVFIENIGTERLVEIEGGSMNEEAIIQQWDFHTANHMRWIFELDTDGYFGIKSVKSGKYIGVDSTDCDVVLQYTEIDEYSLWKISETTDGHFKISCKSATLNNYVLASPADNSGNGENLTILEYTEDTNYEDEWSLTVIGTVIDLELEGQQMSAWCWVASARMFAKNHYPNITTTQSEAVEFVKGGLVNHGGSRLEAAMAMNYYVTNTPFSSLATCVIDGMIYDEATLKRFLDDGYVIYISRGVYSDISDPESREYGHATIISGYLFEDGICKFLIHDPDPVNVGSYQRYSYQKLVNGRNPQGLENPDSWIWDGAIVFRTSYYTSTIPYYFDQQ